MPLSFPSSPSVNQTATINGRTYRWTGSVWEFVSSGGGSDSRWDLFLPPAPTSLTATGGNAQVALTWTAPTVLAQTPITGYTVEYTPSGSSASTVSTGSTATSYTLTGLTNGTSYSVRVRATNAVGTGSYSSSASVTPTAGGSTFTSSTAFPSTGTSGNTLTGTGTNQIVYTVASNRDTSLSLYISPAGGTCTMTFTCSRATSLLLFSAMNFPGSTLDKSTYRRTISLTANTAFAIANMPRRSSTTLESYYLSFTPYSGGLQTMTISLS